jgi:tetratricopeptide (TPR) repeat protein
VDETFNLYEVLLKGGKLADAEKLLLRALAVQRAKVGDSHPSLIKPMRGLADIFKGRDRHAEAEEILNQALQIELMGGVIPIKNSALEDLTVLLKEQDRSADVATLLRDAVARVRNQGQTEQLAALLTQFGNWLLQNGNKTAQAEEAFREALEISRKLHSEDDPNIGLILNRLTSVLRAEDKAADIAALWQKRLDYWQSELTKADNDERRAQIHLRLFWSLKYTGQIEEAKAACRKALALKPSDAATVINLSTDALELATSADPACRDWALSEALYDRALEIARKVNGDEHPSVMGIMDALAAVLSAQGKPYAARFESLWRERLALWEKELSNSDSPARRTQIYLMRVRLMMYCGQIEEAKESCRMALESKSTPDAAAALNDISWFLATFADPALRNSASAVQLAQKAAELRPQDWMIRNTLGVARYRAGDFKGAVEELEKSVQLGNGGHSADFFFLAMAQQRLGDAKAAREWYEKGVKWMDQNAPQNEELRRFRAEAEELLGGRP